ncbi:MAG: acylphosphatase [Verrucomicrobia bacterium]|nr:acylphosphatase [Verrucomicrobiota bacterium]
MSAFLIHYAGHVQGVGFRYSVKQLAAGFEVTGTVRNLPDGRVELRVQGTGDEVEAFLQDIRESGLRHYIHEETRAATERDPHLAGFVIAH